MSVRFGLESAIGAAATVRKSYATATPSETTGFPAAALLEEPLGSAWRTATTNPADTGALVRFVKDRQVGGLAALRHNLGPHACWRAALGEHPLRPASRPVLILDGADDTAVASGIVSLSDITVFGTVLALMQPPANETAASFLLSHNDDAGAGAANVRWRMYWQRGNLALPFQLVLEVFNYGTVTFNTTGVLPDNLLHRFAFRYRNSDQFFDLRWDGVVVASGTAATSWAAPASERIFLCSTASPSLWGRAGWQDLRLRAGYATDAEVAAYSATIATGPESGLVSSWHFLEGAGTTVADAMGVSPFTVTGGAWTERLSRTVLYSVDRSVWGPWSSRKFLNIKPGVYVKSPALSNIRSITIAFTFRWSSRAVLVDGGRVITVGADEANPQLAVETTSAGKLRLRSVRGGSPVTVTSAAALNTDTIGFGRLTLDGHLRTATLYVGAPGNAEVSQGSVAVGAYPAVTPRLILGDSTATLESTIQVSDVRVYPQVLLEADDSLGEDAPAWRREAWAMLRLDGAVRDGVDTSREYTTGGTLAYSRYARSDDHGGLEAAADGLHEDSADPFSTYPRRLLALAGADVTAGDLYLQVDDRDNADGYVQISTLLPQATWELPAGSGDVFVNHARPRRTPGVSRSRFGAAALDGSTAADALTLEIRAEARPHEPGGAYQTVADEFDARLYARRDPSRLVSVWTDQDCPAHRLVERVTVGYVTGPSPRQQVDSVFSAFRVEVDGAL